MTITRHELRQGRRSFLIWTVAIGFMLAICVCIFPEMKQEMDSISDMFASMGAFTSAFGMDRLDFGTITGYYAVECGNVLGLGGAFYAALTAGGMLCKEEKDRTTEFLLTQPLGRRRILTEKLAAVFLFITAMNLFLFALPMACMAVIGEPVPFKKMMLMHLAYYLLQLELAAICFGCSAFLRRGHGGLSLGIAVLMYFLNLLANITESVGFLKNITPYGYCDAADIIAAGSLDGGRLGIGVGLAVLGIAAAYWKYPGKDIH